MQIFTAIIAMLGGIITAFADQFERAPSGVRIASTDEYGKLIEMRANIEIINLKLERDKIIQVQEQELRDMLTQIDQYAAAIVRLKMA